MFLTKKCILNKVHTIYRILYITIHNSIVYVLSMMSDRTHYVMFIKIYRYSNRVFYWCLQK